ncbi:fimb protein, partial [Bacillus stratosphericus]
MVALIQLAALVYGLNAVAAARPVVVAFETDRFTVVSAAEIDKAKLHEAPEELRQLPWSGVRRIALRKPNGSGEALASLEMSLQGIEPSARPGWWLADNQKARDEVRAKMQPVSKLLSRYP